MGTWSTGSFGNDEALDWFGDLREAPEAMPFIEETVANGSTESIIAAGAFLAVLTGHPTYRRSPGCYRMVCWRTGPVIRLETGGSGCDPGRHR
jgi:hypothetical protein